MRRQGRRSARDGGFSLIEVAVATVTIGVAVAALLTTVSSGTQTNDAGKRLTQAVFVAQEIREWTLRLPFTDPDPGDQGNPPGPDGSSPQVWVDDLDDLMDVTYQPPRDGRGYAITDMPRWSETLTLTWRNPDNLSAEAADGSTDVVHVQVEVRYRDRPVLTTGWLVTNRE